MKKPIILIPQRKAILIHLKKGKKEIKMILIQK